MKTSQLKMIIREVVREEIRSGLLEIIGDMKQPTKRVVKPKSKVVEKQDFSTNPIINEVLNETAMNDEWKTMGGGTYDSNRADEVMSSAYGKMMSDDDSDKPNKHLARQMGMNPEDPSADFLTKDYRGLMKAIDKKQGK